jgi:hypothetical protein
VGGIDLDRRASGVVFEAARLVAGLDDVEIMREPVEQSSCHHCVAEEAWSFPEWEVYGHDDVPTHVELGDQIEQQLTNGLGERRVGNVPLSYLHCPNCSVDWRGPHAAVFFFRNAESLCSQLSKPLKY